MKLIQLILAIYIAINVTFSQNLQTEPAFQCRNSNSCEERQLAMLVERGTTKITNLVKQVLSNKIAELEQYGKDFDEFAMGNQIGEYLAERFSMGLPELQDSNIELRDSIRSYILSADTDYSSIINQLDYHNTVVTLQELVRVIEIQRDRNDGNREKLQRLVGALKSNRECVLSYISEQILSKNESNSREVGTIIERLSVFLRAIRVVASPREFIYVIRNLREILAKYKVRKFCQEIWLANIGCRSCNDSTGRSITRACNGLCYTTVWVCLAPLVRAVRGANDVITYKRVLAEETESQTESMRLPSVESVADELESLTREAIQRIKTDDLVSNLPRIARACAFNADIADTDTGVDIRDMLNDRIKDFSNNNTNSVHTVSTMSPTRSVKDEDTQTTQERESTMPSPPGDAMPPPPRDTMPPPKSTMSPPDADNGGRGRRELPLISIPLPPHNLLPSIIRIISNICTAEYSTISNDRCWNGTNIDTFSYNIDYSIEADENTFEAAGIEFSQEEYLAETAAISGSTNPCEGVQGESEEYYNVISNSSSVCLQEEFGNGSIGVTANMCLLVIAISFMLLQAFYI